MELHFGFDTLVGRRTVVTVGSFDGVHAGHGELIATLRAMASRPDAESVGVTFAPHPRVAMGRTDGFGLLTTVEERAYLLARCGVKHVVVAHFDDAFRSLSYEEFVQRLLVERLGMVGMVVGYNHRLGRNSEGGFEGLQSLGARQGFEVERVAQYTDDGDKVSSTVIRTLFSEGNIRRVAQLLGHPYIIMGKSTQGVLRVDEPYKILPSEGSYRATVNGVEQEVSIRGRSVMMDTSCEGDVVVEFQ